MHKLSGLLGLPLLALGLIAAGPAPLRTNGMNIMTWGNTEAKTCADHAKLVSDGMMSPAFAVETCTEALNIETLNRHDLAATFNNRGVLYMTMADYGEAREDFAAAAKVEPALGEISLNSGVVNIRMNQNAEAIADLDRSLVLGVKEPWKAYLNRGFARENLGDVKGAYDDYVKAKESKPDWAPATTELARFTVKGR